MNNFFDAFISYGRADSEDFALQLNQRLTEQGLNVWFDRDDIPLAVDYQEQIDRGIAQSNNFIFIIAPHSVNSKYCLKEIDLAVKYNKRIIPLLHVEQITQATWRGRNPAQTEADWQEYRVKGLDSSLANLHQAIAKINWIYCRANLDDLAASFAGLIQAIDQHQVYVAQHTKFLLKALDWLSNQKQVPYLLIGSERQEAKTWLKRKFADEQPPCIPTDLHCEFISESIKNANNLMTQVFLSASEKDGVVKEKIGKSLMREGLTIWTNQADIRSGTAFKQEIERGIEGADTFVYLLSANTRRSLYCQQELSYALANHKYIIPLLIQATEPESIPSELRELQFIDLTKFASESNYRRGINKLLKELKSNAYYLETQKLLLVKALKWHRQNQNPSLLLRSYNLQHFVDWLKIVKQRQNYASLPIQSEFIAESLKQPQSSSLEVFISYSRADSDFARKLNDALTEVGKLTWFDQESIASGADFQQEIYRGIEQCDNFLLIISPKSVSSPYCAAEVKYAHQLNKRFVTVVYQQVTPQDLHPILAQIQWIDFNQHEGNFSANFPKLVRAIDTDREHVHNHTKWSQRAREWLKRGKTDDLLLRGSEFILAQSWLESTRQATKQPTFTNLQQEFIATSEKKIDAEAAAKKERQAQIFRLQQERTQEAEARLAEQTKYAKRQKFFAGLATIGFTITTGLGLAALWEYRKSKISEVNAMILSSEALFASDDKLDALIEAVRAKRQLQKLEWIVGKEPQNTVERALQKVVYTIEEYNRLSGHYGAVLGVAFSPDQELIASGSADNTVILWEQNGSKLTTLVGHEGSVKDVAFSPNGQLIASASADNTIKLWRRDGTLLKTFKGQKGFNRVAFSADGTTLALASQRLLRPKRTEPAYSIASTGGTPATAFRAALTVGQGTVELWRLDRHKFELEALLKGDNRNGGSFNSVAFSPDDRLIAAGSDDATIKIWRRNGTLIDVLEGHQDRVIDLAFSPNSQLIASASADNTIKIWQRDGTLVKTLKGHLGSVKDVAFSPNGQRIVSGSQDRTLKIWQIDGTLLLTLKGHRDQVTAVDFSPDGRFILSGSDDNTVRLWQPDNSLLTTLYGHQSLVRAVDFSPDGQFTASASEDNTVKLWQIDGTLSKTLTGHSDRVYSVAFSPDGQFIASASADQTIKLWQIDGTLSKTLIGHSDRVYSVAFSPDGQLIASASADQTIKLWNLQGELLKTFTGHREEVNAVVFSPDGQFIISGSGDNTIKLWNLQGELLKTFTGHKSTVFALDISPDGQLIISGSGDNTIKLWNLQGELLEDILGHSDSVLGVKFHPNSQTIATASVDRTIKLWLWDGKQANLEKTLMGHDGAVQSIDFNPDGKTLASGSSDQTVILWTNHGLLNPNDLLEHGCSWAGNYLQHNQAIEERSRYLCDGVKVNH